MAEVGRRESVQDPLAINGREQRPERSLALQGVRPPNNGDPNAVNDANKQTVAAMDNLFGAVNNVLAAKRDESLTAGKAAYLAGVTQQEMQKNGDAYYQTGWKALQARDTVNTWFTKEGINIAENAKNLTPDAYQGYLNRQRAQILDGIDDPYAKQVAVAAFEEMSPRLAQGQVVANNEQNKINTYNSFRSTLTSTATVSQTGTTLQPGKFIPTTATEIQPPVQASAEDRDIAIKTVIGEAAGEGADGMAAVAHVLRNRLAAGKYGGSIKDVALAEKQFSVWNDGGTSMRDMVPGNPMYDKAASIVDDVFSGKTVDQTGGATHYFAPDLFKAQTGKDKPDWFDGEAKGKVAIKLGGHVFLGTGNPNNTATGTLAFDHPDQENGMKDDLKNILKSTAGVMGGSLKITSGYRSPEHNKAVGGAKYSEHMHGNAADIDMSGMNDQQRAQLVRELQSRGAKGFITYTNEPNRLHVDLKDRGAGGGFMFDKSKDNMGRAPEWFKGVAQEQPGKAVADAGHGGTEVQGLIRGFNQLDGPTKAAAVSDAMRQSLDTGDGKFFNDAGGVAMLYELGAKDEDINAVLKAKERYDNKQTAAFSVEKEQFSNDILSRAEKGDDLNSLYKAIDDRVKQHFMSDAEAKSLAGAASDKFRAQANRDDKQSKLGDPKFLSDLGGVYQKIKTGASTFEQASATAEELAKKYGATPADVKTIMGNMFNIDQEYKDSLRKKAEEYAKNYGEQEVTKAGVTRAIAQGYGLGDVKGTEIKTVNDYGQPTKMSAQDYGIKLIKDKWQQKFNNEVNTGNMSEGQAKAAMVRMTTLELQKHGVVDPETRSQITGALTGNIVDPSSKTGLKDSAAKAYDAWLTLRNTPGVSEGYLAKIVDDPETRSLIETAYRLDSGDLDGANALLKAHEILTTRPDDIHKAMAKDAIWMQKRDNMAKDFITKKLTPSFWEQLTNPSGSDLQEALKNRSVVDNYVNQQADIYHMQNPNEDAEVSLTKAMQDFQNNASIVAGNVVIARSGQDLTKVMGIDSFGPQSADKAVKDYIGNHALEWWGKAYTDRRESYAGAAWRNGGVNMPVHPDDPPVLITYDPGTQMLSIDLYKDDTKKQTYGTPIHVLAKDIGQDYIKKQTEPTVGDKMFKSIFENLGSAARTSSDWQKKAFHLDDPEVKKTVDTLRDSGVM